MCKIVAVILHIFFAGQAFAQTPQTEIEVEGRGSYFYEEHHPTKFDFSTMTFCGGRNSESENANFDMQREVRKGNSGSWDAYMNVGANKGILQSLINQKLEWNSAFDSKEYTFNVRLKKQAGRGAETTHRNTCNTRTWRYKVDAARSRFSSSVSVAVPDHVYVVRIRTSGIKTGVQTQIKQVMSIGLVKDRPQLLEGLSLGDGTRYFFVNPGEEIRIQVSHDDVGTDVNLVADFEITFIGHNRCEKGIAEFRTLSGMKHDGVLTRDVIANAFAKVTKGLEKQSPTVEESLHQTLLFLGCLTSQSVAKSMIYDNGANQTNEILNGIADFKASVLKLSRESIVAGENIKVHEILDAMARNAVATSVVRGMKPLCQRYPFVSENRVSGYVTGYLMFRHRLDLIDGALGHGDIGKYLQGMVSALEQMNGHTYASLIKDRKAQLELLIADYEANRKASLIEEAERQFQILPPVEPSRDVVGMSVEMAAMKKLILRVNEEFIRQIDLFAINSMAQLDLSHFKKAVADFVGSESRFQRHLKRTQKDFADENASAFAHIMRNLNDRHIEVTRQWMQERYGGFLNKFADFQKEQMGGAETAKELEKCINHPVSTSN